MTSIMLKEARQLATHVGGHHKELIDALVDRLEKWESVFGHLGEPDEVGNEWGALSDRLEETESECLEQARLNGMGGEREAALMAKLEAVERERDWHAERCEDAMNECAALRSKIEAVEQQEPAAWTTKLALEYGASTLGFRVSSVNIWGEKGVPLYALPGAQNVPKAVAYLDLGTSGYMDIGTDLTDEELAALPKGRHILGVIGTYGVDGYVPAQPAPSVPEGWKLVPIEPTPSMKTAGIGVEVYQDSPPAADCLTWEEVEAIYTAMIEVAPEVKSCI